MSNFKRAFFIMATSLLAALALPTSAADKLFVLTDSPAVVPPGPATTVNLVLTNQTPTGANSVINSVKIDVPSGVTFKIVSFQTVNGNSTSSAGTSSPPVGQVTNGGTTISFQNITGAKPKGTFTVTLSVTPTVSSCTPAQWTAYAFTGNSFSGNLFIDPNTGATNSVAAAYLGCDGILNCGDVVGNLAPPLDGTTDSGLTRGPNTSGSCVAIPYSFDFITSGTQTASFIAIKSGQNPSVEYVMAWNPVNSVEGWTNFRPSVSWGTVGNNPPIPNTTDYVPALACLSGDLNNPNSIMPTIPDDSGDVPPGPFSTSPYSQFQPGIDPMTGLPRKAKMCIAEHTWVSVGGQVQYFDRVIDQSDGWVKGP